MTEVEPAFYTYVLTLEDYLTEEDVDSLWQVDWDVKHAIEKFLNEKYGGKVLLNEFYPINEDANDNL
jgi:hypothetical protein